MRTWIWSATHTSPRLREGTCLKKKGEDQKRKAVSINCWPYKYVHTHELTDTHSTYMSTHMNRRTRTPHTWFLTSQKYYFVLKKTVLKYAACCFKKIPYFLYYLINKISNEEKQKWEPESWPADCDAPWFTNRDESYSPQEKQFSLDAENMQTCQTGPLFHQDFYFLSV